jgi:hypothetical protein
MKHLKHVSETLAKTLATQIKHLRHMYETYEAPNKQLATYV